MAPRRIKSTERQRSNTPSIVVPIAAQIETPKLPAPPKGTRWLKASRISWDEFWASDISHMVNSADMPAIFRLWRNYDERDRLHADYSCEYLVRGSQGQPVLNPLVRRIESLDKAILALEERFGITPLARFRLGIEGAEAKDALDAVNQRLAAAGAAADSAKDPRLFSIPPTGTDE